MYFKTDRLGAFQSADNRAAGKVNLRSGLMVLTLVAGFLAVTLLLAFGLRRLAAAAGIVAAVLFVLAAWDPKRVLRRHSLPDANDDLPAEPENRGQYRA